MCRRLSLERARIFGIRNDMNHDQSGLHDVTVCVRCMAMGAVGWGGECIASPSHGRPPSHPFRSRVLMRDAAESARPLPPPPGMKHRSLVCSSSPCFDPCFDPTSHQGPPGPGGPGAPGGFTVSSLRIRHSRFPSGAARGDSASRDSARQYVLGRPCIVSPPRFGWSVAA